MSTVLIIVLCSIFLYTKHQLEEAVSIGRTRNSNSVADTPVIKLVAPANQFSWVKDKNTAQILEKRIGAAHYAARRRVTLALRRLQAQNLPRQEFKKRLTVEINKSNTELNRVAKTGYSSPYNSSLE